MDKETKEKEKKEERDKDKDDDRDYHGDSDNDEMLICDRGTHLGNMHRINWSGGFRWERTDTIFCIQNRLYLF